MTTEPAHFAPANTVAGPGDGGGGGGSGGLDGNVAAALPRVGKRGAPQAFARKLFEILTTESHAVIAWNDDGTAFHVKDVESFSEETLTKYYRHSKFSSFQRQLNLYSFRKIVKGPDAGGYAHPMFRRDKPDDLYHVRRSISGSSRYEPPASAGSAKGAASAARRNAGRAGSKATAGSEWAPSRAHKSGGAARRVGKLRHPGGARAAAASSSARRADHRRKQQPPPATAVILSQGEDASAGERSPWTSGESSDSDVSIKDAARGTGKQQQKKQQRRQRQQQQPSFDESDSDLSDAEQRDETNAQDQHQDGEEEDGEDEEEQQQNRGEVEKEGEGGVPGRRTSRATAGLMAAWRRGESSLGGGDATKREQQQRSKRFSCAAAAEKEAGEGAAAAVGSDGTGLNKGGSGGSGEGQNQGAPASPARKSPFNFFKKTFSFMERVRGAEQCKQLGSCLWFRVFTPSPFLFLFVDNSPKETWHQSYHSLFFLCWLFDPFDFDFILVFV